MRTHPWRGLIHKPLFLTRPQAGRTLFHSVDVRPGRRSPRIVGWPTEHLGRSLTVNYNMSLCNRCITGYIHEGDPQGREEVINGVKTYIATPEGNYPTDRVVLYLPDVFGIELKNSRLLSDNFARNGLKIYAIDYFSGDAIPPELLLKPGSTFDFDAWIGKHGQKETRPHIDSVIAGLRKQGVTQFAATGYCFGARYAFDLAFDRIIQAAVVAHPSLLQVPDDFVKFKKMGIPLLINSCEVDQRFPQEHQKVADDILGNGSQESALYKREYFEGCSHGFTVRGDLSDPKVRAAREGAFEATTKFFWKHLYHEN